MGGYIAVTIATFAEQLRSLPDLLERRAGLAPEQAKVVEHVVNAELEALRERLLAAVAGKTPPEALRETLRDMLARLRGMEADEAERRLIPAGEMESTLALAFATVAPSKVGVPEFLSPAPRCHPGLDPGSMQRWRWPRTLGPTVDDSLRSPFGPACGCSTRHAR